MDINTTLEKIENARGEEYQMLRIDRAISELVIPKYNLLKYYNYYNGKRDAELFRYLEENFGIGQPTAVEFTPLVRKHLDTLIGEYLDVPVIPKVSCKDKETISKITRDKELEINQQVFSYLQSHLNNKLLAFLDDKKLIDSSIQAALDKLVLEIDESFISNYEIAALNVIEYVLQSRHTDFTNKLKALLLDLLVTGSTFYKVGPSSSGTNLDIEILSPLNVFYERNPNSVYVKDCYRLVVRRWMTRSEILTKYGDKLSKDAIEEMDESFRGYANESYMYVRSLEGVGVNGMAADGLDSGKEVVPGFPYEFYSAFNYRLLPVYEVEWLETDKEDGKYITNRYEGVKISNSIYVLVGKSESVIRSNDNPEYCGLSVNGIFFTNRTGMPYSLMGACMHLQD